MLNQSKLITLIFTLRIHNNEADENCITNLRNGDNKTKSSIKPIKKNNDEHITMGKI